METLFYISGSAFVIAALTWYSVWAFFIHPPEGWLGRRLVTVMPVWESEHVRHSAWFRWLKITTVLLGALTAATFGIWLAEHKVGVHG